MNSTLDNIASDLPKATNLLSELSSNATNVSNTIKSIVEKIKNENIQTEEGISLLELKNHTFTSYLANLSYTSLLKLSGICLKENFTIDNLVELRVILEKIRPIEDKLKHQIQNYIKVGSGVKPTEAPSEEAVNNLDNIDDSSDDETSSNTKKDENKIYKMPRISQMRYPEEEEKNDHRQKRERMRALSSAMFKDALEEHLDDPEVHHNMDTLKHKAAAKRREIERYEEDNFVRLTLTKKQKAAINQMSTASNIASELLSFRSVDGFSGHNSKTSLAAGSKKRKRSKGKGQKGFKKKRKH